MSATTTPTRSLIERLARGIHERYLNHETRVLGHSMGSRPGLVAWDDLPEPMQDSNRGQAAGFAAALADRGLALTIATGDEPLHTFTPGDVEYLARVEHHRWSDQKRAQGYRYGPVRNDDPADLRHPSLRPWDQLDEPDRERDRDTIRNMPAVLAADGLAIVPAARP